MGQYARQSIGKLFIAGIIPGVILSLLFMGYIVVRVAIGAIMALIFSLAYRKLNWSILKQCLRSTVKTSTMIMFLFVGAQVLVAVSCILRIPDHAVTWVVGLPVPPLAILLLIYFLYLFLGCFMDGTSLMVVTLPIVFPIIVALGFDPIWFAVALVILIEMALLTPPVGINVYVIHGLRPDYPLTDVFIGIIPFFFMMAIGLAIVTAFPILATWLPAIMMQ